MTDQTIAIIVTAAVSALAHAYTIAKQAIQSNKIDDHDDQLKQLTPPPQPNPDQIAAMVCRYRGPRTTKTPKRK